MLLNFHKLCTNRNNISYQNGGWRISGKDLFKNDMLASGEV